MLLEHILALGLGCLVFSSLHVNINRKETQGKFKNRDLLHFVARNLTSPFVATTVCCPSY